MTHCTRHSTLPLALLSAPRGALLVTFDPPPQPSFIHLGLPSASYMPGSGPIPAMLSWRTEAINKHITRIRQHQGLAGNKTRT